MLCFLLVSSGTEAQESSPVTETILKLKDSQIQSNEGLVVIEAEHYVTQVLTTEGGSYLTIRALPYMASLIMIRCTYKALVKTVILSCYLTLERTIVKPSLKGEIFRQFQVS